MEEQVVEPPKEGYDPVNLFPLPIPKTSIEELKEKVVSGKSLSYWEQYKVYFSEGTVLNHLMEILKFRCEADNDSVIAISGNRGIGKSSLAILLARHQAHLMESMGCRAFNLKNDVIYYGTKQEVYDKTFGEKNKLVPNVVDEVLTFASKHKWQSKENLSFEDTTLVSRFQRKTFYLVGPRLMDMSEVFRNQRVILNIEILERGKAALFRRFPSTQVSDPWFIRQVEKMIIDEGRRFMDATTYQKQMFYEKNISNFVGMIYFPKLDSPTDRAYKFLSDFAKESKVRPSEEVVKEEDVKAATTVLFYNLYSQGKSIDELSKLSGLPVGLLSRRINLYAKKLLKETEVVDK